jgi:hypothetical protein
LQFFCRARANGASILNAAQPEAVSARSLYERSDNCSGMTWEVKTEMARCLS